MGFGYFTSRLGRLRGTVLALLLAVNPVSMAQLFTNYVDGSLGDLVLIAMVVLTMQLDPGWVSPKWWSLAQWPTIAAAFVLLANLKFTGLLYAGIVGVVYLVALLIKGRERRRDLFRLALTGVASGVVAVAVVGASSYVRNLITNGNPLAPLFGNHAADVLAIGGEPAYVEGRDRFTAFILSNLSVSSSDGTSAGLKVPFTFSIEQLRMFDWVDVRIGGYGVWFGGILIVSVIVGVIAVLRARSRAMPYLPLFLAPLAVILANVGLVDGSWWARYVPELCVVPLLAVVALWGTGGGISRWLGWLLLAATTLNVLWIVAAQVRQQVLEWPDPPLAEQVASGGCNAVYPGTTFTGLAFNAVDMVPGVHVLTKQQFEQIAPESFFAATPRVWLLHPLLIERGC